MFAEIRMSAMCVNAVRIYEEQILSLQA